jgi:cation:H+ antiporter
MWFSLFLILLGLVSLTLGAEWLVRGSSSLALKLGVTPLAVGLTVVAIGTSTPELAVNLNAALEHNSAIALGNIIGSNIANIGLILGTSALIRPINSHPQTLKRDVPLMIAITFALGVMLLDGEIGRLDGALLFAGSIAYIAWTYISARQENARANNDATPTSRAAWFDVTLIVVGLGTLVFGANELVDGAVALAQSLGVSPIIIALSVVAVGTSLPEFATSVVASHKRVSDISLGNAVGSNILNILLILGTTALIQPIHAREIRWLDLGAMIFFAVILLPMMHVGSKVTRREGALLLLAYAIYVLSLVSVS